VSGQVDPRFIADAREWADFITLPLNQIGVIIRRLDNPEHWKQWAFHLIQSETIAAFNPPDPRFYEDWREWAFRFNQAVQY